jgi:hypothetical protein
MKKKSPLLKINERGELYKELHSEFLDPKYKGLRKFEFELIEKLNSNELNVSEVTMKIEATYSNALQKNLSALSIIEYLRNWEPNSEHLIAFNSYYIDKAREYYSICLLNIGSSEESETSKTSSIRKDNTTTHKQQYILLQELGIIDFLRENTNLNISKLAQLISEILSRTDGRNYLTYIQNPNKNENIYKPEHLKRIHEIFTELGLIEHANKLLNKSRNQ